MTITDHTSARGDLAERLEALLDEPDLTGAMVDGTRSRAALAGIDPSEYTAVTSSLRSGREWPAAFIAAADRHAAIAASAQDRGRHATATEALRAASLWFHFATCIPHPDRSLHQKAARSAHQCLQESVIEAGLAVEQTVVTGEYGSQGILRRPEGSDHPPLVIIAPGMDSSAAEFALMADALERRGIATLSIDGPGQGVLSGLIPARFDYEHVVSAALDALADRGDLGLDRIGIVGLSLGGFYAPRAAAHDPRVRAAATVTGPYRFGPWEDMWPVVQHTLIQRTAGEPAAQEFSRHLDLTGTAGRVTQPLLVVAGGRDVLCTATEARRLVYEATAGELLLIEQGDHLCANSPWLWRPHLADWLADQLNSTRPPSRDAPEHASAAQPLPKTQRSHDERQQDA